MNRWRNPCWSLLNLATFPSFPTFPLQDERRLERRSSCFILWLVFWHIGGIGVNGTDKFGQARMPQELADGL